MCCIRGGSFLLLEFELEVMRCIIARIHYRIDRVVDDIHPYLL